MSKSKAFILFIIVINILIFICVDSIYCSKDWFFIALGLIPQGICTFLLLQGEFLNEKDSNKVFSKERAIIFIFICFLSTYNGNLGVDKTGRTDDCPNTWLLYLSN